MLCEAIGGYGESLGMVGVRSWCVQTAEIPEPAKSDQDKLDAVICVLVTYLWWRFGRERSLVVGHLESGYIVTSSNQFTRERILRAATLHRVPVDAVFLDDSPGVT